MTPKDQRAADQDTAIERAFVAGTLPEEDRRTPEERRDADQAAAEGSAFAAGILPEEDRRAAVESVTAEAPDGSLISFVAEEEPAAEPVAEAADHVKPQVSDVLDAIEKSQVGTTFERAAHGWNVKWVDGGTVIRVQGATITEALGSHSAQVIHVVAE